MEEISFEEMILEKISESDNANVSWEDFTTQLSENEDAFNLEIQKMERLDIEAQNEALTFYVR